MVSIRLAFTIIAVLFVLAVTVNAAYRKPPFNGSIFGKRSNTITGKINISNVSNISRTSPTKNLYFISFYLLLYHNTKVLFFIRLRLHMLPYVTFSFVTFTKFSFIHFSDPLSRVSYTLFYIVIKFLNFTSYYNKVPLLFVLVISCQK